MKNNKPDDIDIIDSILHDIKSPLSNISGYTKLLLSSVIGEINPEQRDYLLRIKRNTHRIGLYIEDVAEVARILHLKETPELREVDISVIIRDSIERNDPILSDYKSAFFLHNITSQCIIVSDATRLSRTIDVLISNLTKDINKRKILIATNIKDRNVQVIISHIAETTSDIPSLLQRFESSDDRHLIRHAATSTIILRSIGGSIKMYTSSISERMFILTFPLK